MKTERSGRTERERERAGARRRDAGAFNFTEEVLVDVGAGTLLSPAPPSGHHALHISIFYFFYFFNGGPPKGLEASS